MFFPFIFGTKKNPVAGGAEGEKTRDVGTGRHGPQGMVLHDTSMVGTAGSTRGGRDVAG